jgi:cysteine synthase A
MDWEGFDPEAVGHTPLIEIEGVFAKLECSNPGGSVKDRIGVFMLREAMRRGELKSGDTVVEGTSGNTGIALALATRALGLKALIFMPEHMSEERRTIMERFGAEVRLTPREESFAGACARRDEYAGRPGYFIPDQFGNPDNTRCHRETTGREIIAQLRERGIARADAFVAGIGTGGTLMGVGEALQAEWPGTRIVAVEPTESAVLGGGPAGEHGIMGIGDGFVPALVDVSKLDQVVAISTAEAHATAERIRRVHGHCVGRSSGANLAAALLVAAGGGTVVTVFSDCADRYQSLGLESPASDEVSCPSREHCRKRTAAMLGT